MTFEIIFDPPLDVETQKRCRRHSETTGHKMWVSFISSGQASAELHRCESCDYRDWAVRYEQDG